MVPLSLARLMSTLDQLRWLNPPQIKEGTMPIFLKSFFPLHGTLLRTALARRLGH